MRRVVFFMAGKKEPAAKGSGHWQARLRLAIIVTVIVVTSAAVLSPFVISWALHASTNGTRVQEMVQYAFFLLTYRTVVFIVSCAERSSGR